MPRTKTRTSRTISLLRHIQRQLADIDAKLDHLIKAYRQFHLTDDFFSRSTNHEFKG